MCKIGSRPYSHTLLFATFWCVGVTATKPQGGRQRQAHWGSERDRQRQESGSCCCYISHLLFLFFSFFTLFSSSSSSRPPPPYRLFLFLVVHPLHQCIKAWRSWWRTRTYFISKGAWGSHTPLLCTPHFFFFFAFAFALAERRPGQHQSICNKKGNYAFYIISHTHDSTIII